jgi:hypothetical protein
MLFSFTILATVTPYFAAIEESVSPDLTVYDAIYSSGELPAADIGSTAPISKISESANMLIVFNARFFKFISVVLLVKDQI